MIVTQRQLAAAFRVSPRTIRRWGDDGLDHARREGGYDLAEAIAWRIADLEDGEEDAFAEARTRRMNALARRSELLAAEEEGDLLRTADHDEVVGKLVYGIRAAIDQVPGWGPRLVGITTPAEGRERAEGLRDDLLRSLQGLADELDAEADEIQGGRG